MVTISKQNNKNISLGFEQFSSNFMAIQIKYLCASTDDTSQTGSLSNEFSSGPKALGACQVSLLGPFLGR